MATDQDVVVVGGGPAGLATALCLLHREPRLAGRLVVLEKDDYPREKFCAGAIGGRGELALARIGVVVDVPAVPVAAIVADLPQGRVEGRAARIGRVVRRIEYDARLAEIARDRGVRIETGVKATALAVSGGVARLETSQGMITTKVVVGADGVGSVVRRAIGLGTSTWRAQVLEVDTEPTGGDGPRDALAFDVRDRAFNGYAWDFPSKVGGREVVCRGVYHLAMPGEKAGEKALEERLGQRLRALGLDLGACKKKRFAERGFAPHEGIAAPHVLLAGEAAGIDPITGEGIAQALLYGELVAAYVAPRLAAGALDFGDFRRALAATRLGQDLRVRHFLCRRFFAGGRAFYEESLVDLPEFMQLGVRYFAGLPVPRGAALRFLGKAFARSFRKGTLRAFETVPSSA